VDALAEQIRELQQRLTLCEQNIARLINCVMIMGQAGQTLEDRVDEMEIRQFPELVVPSLIKPH
jgi:hypothetical protein